MSPGEIPPSLRVGDFVWCNFPTTQAPTKPGDSHVAYIIDIEVLDDGQYVALAAYTTSTGLVFEMTPIGVRSFGSEEALALGQSKAFRLDLRKVARLPMTEKWFPSIVEDTHGVLGRASKRLRASLRIDFDDLLRKHCELMETVAGPP